MSNTFRLVKRAGENPWFQLLTSALVAMRVLVLPGPAHAFDAGAMASHAHRLFVIGSSPFMHVVKSPLFFVPFLPQYALFLKIVEWLDLSYNPLLELALLKLPTLLAELLIAFLILKIAVHITHDRCVGRVAALLWFVNPTAFWWGAVAGHYAVFGVTAMVLAFYLALRGRQLLALAALSFHAALYYYPVILLPLFLLFFVTKAAKNRILLADLGHLTRMTAAFGLFFVLQLAPLFIADGGLFQPYVLRGLLWHASTSSQSANPFSDVAPIYYFSWYPWPHKLVTGLYPDSQNAATLFSAIPWIAPVGPLLAGIYILNLLRRHLIADRREVYEFRKLVAGSFVVLSLALVTFTGLHNSFVLWLIPLTIIYSVTTSDYRMAAAGLVMGIANQYREASHLGAWMRVVPLADVLRIFPWRHDIPDYVLAGFAKMATLLPGPAFLLLKTPSRLRRPTFNFAPITLSVLLAVELLLFMDAEALMLYCGLWRGDITHREAALEGTLYVLSPVAQSTHIKETPDIQVDMLLARDSSYGDEQIVRKYVYGKHYRRFFTFRLFFRSISERDIRSVMVGGCPPEPIGDQRLWRPEEWGATYDLAACFDEIGPEGLPIPVRVVFDDSISVSHPEDNVFAIATAITSTEYLPDRTWLVNMFAVLGIGALPLLLVVVATLLRG